MWGVHSFETGDIDFRIGVDWIGRRAMTICTIHTFKAIFWQMDGDEGKEEEGDDEKAR